MKKIKLDDIEKENIFQTPSGYFEDLPSIIQARAVREKPQAWYLNLFRQPAMKWAIPALVVVLAAVFSTQLIEPKGGTPTLTAAELVEELSTEEMYAFLMEHTDITHQELLDVAAENQLYLGEDGGQLHLDEDFIEDIDLEDLEELM